MARIAGDRRVPAEVLKVDIAGHLNHSPRRDLCRFLIALPGIDMTVSATNPQRGAHEIHRTIELGRTQILQHLNVLIDLFCGFFAG